MDLLVVVKSGRDFGQFYMTLTFHIVNCNDSVPFKDSVHNHLDSNNDQIERSTDIVLFCVFHWQMPIPAMLRYNF